MVSHKEKELRKKQRKAQVHKAKPRSSKKKSNLGTIIGISIVVLVVIIFLVTRMDSPVSTEGLEPLSLQAIGPNDHTKGNGSLILVEYSDFQCPACAAYAPLLEQLVEDFGDHITFVYRHFPLTQIHRNSIGASRASEAAAIQGAFWEYYDILFENQREWSSVGNPRPFFVRYAQELGLDTTQFEADFDSAQVAAIVQHSLNDAIARNLRGTPSLFLDGRPLVGISTYEDLARQVQRAIQ